MSTHYKLPTVVSHDETPINDQSVGCYYCGETLSAPYVAWHGDAVYGAFELDSDVTEESFANAIYLHPACVYQLAARLMRDVHELEWNHVVSRPEVHTDELRLYTVQRERGVARGQIDGGA